MAKYCTFWKLLEEQKPESKNWMYTIWKYILCIYSMNLYIKDCKMITQMYFLMSYGSLIIRNVVSNYKVVLHGIALLKVKKLKRCS